MITSTFPRNVRGLALGLNAVMVSLGVAAGPTIGGIITQYLTWRWIFYVNVTICLIVLLASMYLYKEQHSSSKEKKRFDPLGAIVLAIGLASLTLGLSFGQEWGWLSVGTLTSLALSLVMLTIGVYVEMHVDQPIVNLSLVTNRVFALATINFMLCMMALFAPGFLLPFYFEELRGFSIIQTS